MADPLHDHSPAERMHLVALAVYRITDRFAAYDEAFGKRLRETATGLLEDIAVYANARTRDAAGTTQLIHGIATRLEALKALLSFVRSRGQAAPTTVDIVLWHIERLAEYFRKEDERMEEHVSAMHPQGVIVGGTFADVTPKPSPAPSTATPATPKPQLAKPAESPTYDTLLGPDSALMPSKPFPSAAVAAIAFPHAMSQRADDSSRNDTSVVSHTGGGTSGNGYARQKRILDFFALNRRAQLKDLLAIFPGVSEKTVRNDLAELCRRGKLRRIGLAPRSHYVLTA